MKWNEYSYRAGTEFGEIHNEVYSKYGPEAHETAHYGWHASNTSISSNKIYNLVNSIDGVRFLVADVYYEMRDVTPIDPVTKEPVALVPILIPKVDSPIRIDFIWKDAGIPFISKQEADSKNLSYNL